MSGSALLTDHPMFVEKDNWRSRAIPVTIHGDGVPTTGVGKGWGEGLEVYSWNSMMATGSTLDFQLYMFSVFNKLLTKPGEKEVWRLISWSFYWLCKGAWPDVDPWGAPYPVGSKERRRALQPLAAGKFGVIVAIRGDLDWYNKCLRLNHYGSAHPCYACPANCVEGDPLRWTEFRVAHSQWMAEVFSNAEWRESNPEPHPLLDLPGTGIQTAQVDWLHTKHLGVDAYMYGSILYLLIFEVLPGGPL